MNRVLEEKDLQFDFSAAICAEQYDDDSKINLPRTPKLVDFIVEWEDSLWLVEVKDPASSRIPPQYRKDKKQEYLGILNEYIEKEQHEDLKRPEAYNHFRDEIWGKLKDTMLFLHLNDQLPPKPIKYLVFVGLEGLDYTELDILSANLHRDCSVDGQEGQGWNNPFIDAVQVFNEDAWKNFIPHCPVCRIGHNN